MPVQRNSDPATIPRTYRESGRERMTVEGTNPDGLVDEDDINPNGMEASQAASATRINIKRGDVVEGMIVRIDRDEILVDIGLKSKGVLSTKELLSSGYGSFNELHVNDKVRVYVIQPETSEKHAVLSLKRAKIELQWRIAEEQSKKGDILKARVIDYNKGGLIVDVAGIQGFVPISQILNLKRHEVASGSDNQETAARLQGMKDKELQLKIININRARNRLILSERLAIQELRQRRREKLLDEIKPGEVRKGVVRNLAAFGAFVDLGGADGLVHISQLAWSRVNHPSEVLDINQEVEVKVLSVDKDKKKIALSIKAAEVDPWTVVEQRYTPGQLVTGIVTKLAHVGSFVRIEDGIEGLIHQSELTPGMDHKTVLHEGAQLQLRILRIDAGHRRLDLRPINDFSIRTLKSKPVLPSFGKALQPIPLVDLLNDSQTEPRLTETEPRLTATTEVHLEADNTAIVGHKYLLQVGISHQEALDFSKPASHTKEQLEILLITNNTIKVLSEQHHSLVYERKRATYQRVNFSFEVLMAGRSSLVIDFYQEQRWLDTVRFEFDAVEYPQHTSVPSEV